MWPSPRAAGNRVGGLWQREDVTAFDPIAWGARRPAGTVLHLDSAAAGRQSRATLEATAAHARLEAECGAYVAQAQVADVLTRLRADVGALFGVPAAGVAFVESASAALAALLDTWPLLPGAAIAVVAAEWGPNIETFERRGLRLVELATDGFGAIDVAALERRLATDPPALVHLTQTTSHRGLVQPVSAAAAACRAAGVPLWVDAAQAIGHVDTATGADAAYAPGRKWLAGPRGVGVLAVAADRWESLDVPRSAMLPSDLPPVGCLESQEAHVAGRIGLANAVREYLADGPAAIAARLDQVGRSTRERLADVPGWAVVGDPKAPGAITGIRPTAGQDVTSVRRQLLD
ncbi:MAG: hercynylcysteine S-oxide lyase, partial [Pseudonocardiales bacterium]|nr:hercynylcysteine S-oxide lyase [Pseudonocardiales bacterium]